MKLEFSWHIFGKYSNIKFHENQCNGSRVVLCTRTDRQHDEAFRSFVKSPKTNSDPVSYYIEITPSRYRVANTAGAACCHVPKYKPRYLLSNVRTTIWTEAFCLLRTLAALFIGSLQFIFLILSLFHCLIDVDAGEFHTCQVKIATDNTDQRFVFRQNGNANGQRIIMRVHSIHQTTNLKLWVTVLFRKGATYIPWLKKFQT